MNYIKPEIIKGEPPPCRPCDLSAEPGMGEPVLAEIIRHPNSAYVGMVVRRVGNYLVGITDATYWDCIDGLDEAKLRILPRGTQIKFTVDYEN